MAYKKAGTSDVESLSEEYYGGMWLFEETLGAEQFELAVMELEPDGRGKEHHHEEENQEEVYLVTDGHIEVEFEDESVELDENEAVYMTPEQTRQVQNVGEERAKVVVIGAKLE
ncbi:MAG: mannose-6-phosphate isomerase-like protein (cupin superfamily) [Halobacteriales archaeon]|jgi:mannose-6-phosphate isomerase-like protein (cupin superfamily)